MCLDLIKNPVKSIENAKKHRSMNKSIGIAILTSIIFAISIGLILFKMGFGANTMVIAGSSIAFFLLSLVAIIFSGLIIQIIANTLGGKGMYYEGLTSSAYSSFMISIGVIIAAIFMLVPYGMIISLIVFAVFFALGFSSLYRSIKELFKTDMITAFVSVSILILTFFVTIYLVYGLSAANSIISALPNIV